jgi:asparaginyl-tRNA synthetase
MSTEWPRITYTDAIDILQAADQKFQHSPQWGEDLQSEHEKYLAGTVGQGKPIFVTHYPRMLKAFYMRAALQPGSDKPIVDCFDLLMPEFCEIAGGSMREHRLDPLVDAMRSRGLLTDKGGSSDAANRDGLNQGSERAGALEWYLDLRKWGCPPHGGFGLGFDRLLAYLSGVQSVRDVVTFPRWYGRCDC